MDGGITYILPSVTTALLGWIGWTIKNSRREQKEFQKNEKEERKILEDKVGKEYLKRDTHALLCANAGLTITKEIKDHFDKKFKEHEDEIKKAIKNNGHNT